MGCTDTQHVKHYHLSTSVQQTLQIAAGIMRYMCVHAESKKVDRKTVQHMPVWANPVAKHVMTGSIELGNTTQEGEQPM